MHVFPICIKLVVCHDSMSTQFAGQLQGLRWINKCRVRKKAYQRDKFKGFFFVCFLFLTETNHLIPLETAALCPSCTEVVFACEPKSGSLFWKLSGLPVAYDEYVV